MLIRLIPAIVLLALPAAAAAQPPAGATASTPPGSPPTARVPVTGGNGSPVTGMAVFSEGPEGVVIRFRISDLPVQARGAWHGVHLHETADCSATDFTGTGGHIDPRGRRHGLLNENGPEPADLPNIWADAAGNINAEVYTTAVTLIGAAGRVPLLDRDGSAVVIHALPDDHVSQPVGSAGSRIACGTIAPE
jgi:Cu-Zn family superoxide dismutase